MNVFRCLNSKVEKPSFTIDIKNIDVCAGHWNSEKEIVEFLTEIENLSYEMETIDRNIVKMILDILLNFSKIEDVKFFRIPAENKLICFVVSDMRKFRKEEDLFAREFGIALKRNSNFAFSVVDMVKEDYKEVIKGTKIFPNNWELDEKMTNKLAKMRGASF